MSQEKISIKNGNGQGITLAAIMNFPEGFDKNKKYPAVIVSHPGGGVKEQTAGLYAKKLAENGFVTIASTDKTKYVVEGANHMSLYDGENDVKEAVSQLAPFFKKNLA